MIQFNLLPDIKIQYLKAKRQKQLVMFSSFIVIAASLAALVILLAIVFGLQKKSMSDLNNDIKTKSAELQSTQDLSKILTVQNQLKSLPTLHNAKPVVPRLFTFLQQVTPTAASISNYNANFALHTMQISGNADSLATVTTFADALKLATYHTASAPSTEKQAFSTVVVTSSRDSNGATYTITLKFDPALFSENSDVTLTVPNVTTRGNSGQTLFKKSNSGQ
ncbi:MAG TPA: hypothetical protein VJP80_08175 [Candidatus Saccharimonadales bacterium]|nr:hypothetical protein [Candidatus Saccharimonadales bacterium]